MNQDELKGKADQAKGRVKQAAGDLVGNERLENEGKADEAGGKVQQTFGRGKEKVGEALKDVGRKLKR